MLRFEFGVTYYRHLVATAHPRRTPEAYLRLHTLPAEQAQVDSAHFGHLRIGRTERPLMGFVMTLSYSWRIFLHFSLTARMDSFLCGHFLAFEAWGGVPRVILSDNLKSAVLERIGDTVRFNPQYLAFACHYRFEPRPVAVARGNEKGRVERSIRYIRENFFAARAFANVDDLNAQARAWVAGAAVAERERPGQVQKGHHVAGSGQSADGPASGPGDAAGQGGAVCHIQRKKTARDGPGLTGHC